MARAPNKSNQSFPDTTVSSPPPSPLSPGGSSIRLPEFLATVVFNDPQRKPLVAREIPTLKGVHLVIRAFLPGMIQRSKGVVVNFSSGWGRSTSPEVAPYCATKWGIEGLTAALAQELPVGLAAVALNPGIIDTRMLRSCFGGQAGNYPTPQEWAKVAVPYLVSLGTRHNGRALTVPGM